MFTPIFVCLIGLFLLGFVSYSMITTGRGRRKGSKKFRKKLFPAFYGKNSMFREDEEDEIPIDEL